MTAVDITSLKKGDAVRVIKNIMYGMDDSFALGEIGTVIYPLQTDVVYVLFDNFKNSSMKRFIGKPLAFCQGELELVKEN